jgi:multidrug resistance efflux pump
MNAKGYIVIVIIAAAIGAWLWMKPAAAPATPEAGTAVTAEQAVPAASGEADELNAVNVEDADFGTIDADTQTL